MTPLTYVAFGAAAFGLLFVAGMVALLLFSRASSTHVAEATGAVPSGEDKTAAQREAAEKEAAERKAAADRATAKKAATEREAAEKAAAEKAAAEKEAAEKEAAKKIAAEKEAAERKMAAERQAAKEAADAEALAKAKVEELQRRLEGDWFITDAKTGDNVRMVAPPQWSPTWVFRAETGSNGGSCSVTGVPETPSGNAYMDLSGLFKSCTYRLDATAEPVAIDLVPPRGNTLLGILEFKEAGVLRIRLAVRVRPTTMELGGQRAGGSGSGLGGLDGEGGFRSLVTLSRHGGR